MARKKSKNRRDKKSGHSQPASPAGWRRVNWSVLFCIVCIAAAGVLWVRSIRQDGEITLAEKPLSLPAELSASGLTPVQKAVALLEKAESELVEQLLREFPKSEFTKSVVIYVYGRRGSSAETTAYCEKLLEHNPNQADVYHVMATQARAKAQFDEAIELWKKALAINPNLPKMRNEIGEALISLGKISEAIKELEEAIKSSPGSVHNLYSHYLLGQAYLQLQQYEKAKENYEKAIPLNPDKLLVARANYGLSRTYAKLKQRDKAKEHMALYKTILDESQSGKTREENVAEGLIEDIGIFFISQRLALMYVDAGSFYINRGYREKAEDLVKNAEQLFQQIILVLPEWSTGYRDLASLYLKTNRKSAMAKELAEKAVALDPAGHNYFVLSRACHANGDRAKAMRAIKRALELKPDNSEYKQWHEALRKGS